MILGIDIGNTRVKMAILADDDAIVYSIISEDIDKETLSNVLNTHNIEGIALTTVRQGIPDSIQELSNRVHFFELTSDSSLPFDICYDTPDTLGSDRLCVMAAAQALHPKSDVLVVNMGTCITYDVMRSDDVYMGGNISLGMMMRIKALHDYTSKLPKVEPHFNTNLLGCDTTEALQNGVFYGIKHEIEAYINTLTKSYNNLHVILTGGDAELFGEILETQIFVHPNMVLLGLKKLYEYNA